MATSRSVVVHGHFYQPPREDPWLEVVEREANAFPAHDWNVRITQECYTPMATARLLDAEGRIARLVNCYEAMSFDVGATLAEWLERAAPTTWRAIVAADRRSVARLDGHGNAIAAPYHHVILPLASPRERRTEIRWGIADFRRRFGREPEGFWCPETAIDEATLVAIAEAGMKFTIVAPHQVTNPPADGLPLTFAAGGGRSLAVCVYDGALSRDVAFGPLLRSGDALTARLLDASPLAGGKVAPIVRAIATDGETFGHHHTFGEMALAAAIDRLARHDTVHIENYASIVARMGARPAATIVSPSAWSCVHGIERWRSDCGCKASAERGWSQAWRKPLRESLTWLAGELRARWAQAAPGVFADPDATLDAYGDIVGQDGLPQAAWVRDHLAHPGEASLLAGRRLLEQERATLRMFTSCAWFFDDVAGLEPKQVLRYAARALELAGDAGGLREGLLTRLAAAKSNDPREGTAADIFVRLADPAATPLARVAAGRAVSTALAATVDATAAPCVDATEDADGALVLTHRRTGDTTRWQVLVRREADGDISAEVTGPDGLHHVLRPAQFAEGYAEPVSRLLTGDDVRTLLAPELRVRLAQGEPVGALAGEAFTHTIRVLTLAESVDELEIGVTTTLRLARLIDRLGAVVPYDAVVAAVQVRDTVPAALRPALAPLARHLRLALDP
jgi:hypothetical protein